MLPRRARGPHGMYGDHDPLDRLTRPRLAAPEPQAARRAEGDSRGAGATAGSKGDRGRTLEVQSANVRSRRRSSRSFPEAERDPKRDDRPALETADVVLDVLR